MELRKGEFGSSLVDMMVVVAVMTVIMAGAIPQLRDTAEVLVSVAQSWNFVDAAGTYGAANLTRGRSTAQRRIDRWVMTNGAYKLREVLLIGSESQVDGKLILKNGRPIPPAN